MSPADTVPVVGWCTLLELASFTCAMILAASITMRGGNAGFPLIISALRVRFALPVPKACCTARLVLHETARCVGLALAVMVRTWCLSLPFGCTA